MLKKLTLLSIFVFGLNFGIVYAKRTSASLPAVSSIETLQGTVQKVSWFEKTRMRLVKNIKLSYALTRNGKRIAFLTYPEKDMRMQQQLEQCVGRSVRLKGTREFVAVDPYWLVTVKNVCRP